MQNTPTLKRGQFNGVGSLSHRTQSIHLSTANAIDLSGLAFTDGITFTFTNGTILGAGRFLVLARNATEFGLRYPGVALGGTRAGAGRGLLHVLVVALGLIIRANLHAIGIRAHAPGLRGLGRIRKVRERLVGRRIAGRDRVGEWNEAYYSYSLNVGVIFASLAIPAIAMLTASLTRIRDRVFFAFLPVAGVAVAVGAGGWV